MNFLQELVNARRVDDEDRQFDDGEFTGDELDGDPQELDFDTDQIPDDGEFTDDELDDVETDGEPSEPEDPNRQGLIRTVKKAHLVYKRQTEEGTYEELWMYNTTSLSDEIAIRKSILSGTDIPVNRTSSPDGEQEYETWSAGNAELMLIRGLPQ